MKRYKLEMNILQTPTLTIHWSGEKMLDEEEFLPAGVDYFTLLGYFRYQAFSFFLFVGTMKAL